MHIPNSWYLIISGEYVCQVSAFQPTKLYHTVKIRGKYLSLKLKNTLFKNLSWLMEKLISIIKSILYLSEISANYGQHQLMIVNNTL